MKKLALFILTLCLLFSSSVSAEETDIEIVFFWGPGCMHCNAARIFLENLQGKYPDLKVQDYELAENIDLVRRYYQAYEVKTEELGYVPAIFVAGDYFIGFNEQIGNKIEESIQVAGGGKTATTFEGIKVPLLGEINPVNVPLPVLAVILGLLDGFNVCSLGALVLILSLVLALRSKKKIITFGGIFILTTVFVYALLVFLWNRAFVFLAPSIKKMELIVAIMSLLGTVYFFREFLKSKRGKATCGFAGTSDKLGQRVKEMFQKKSGVFALGGVVLVFALIVTVIEFPCTAFFPVLFAGILTEAQTSLPTSLVYIAIYMFFYMLDEMIVLIVAAFTFKIWVVSQKAITYLNLFTAILLFFLSFYYLLNVF